MANIAAAGGWHHTSTAGSMLEPQMRWLLTGYVDASLQNLGRAKLPE